jgi:hypothetical protein
MSTAAPLDRASLAKTPEWRNVDPKTFRDQIIPRDRPAVLKGVARDWPLVHAGRESGQALLEYVRARDPGTPQRILVGRPDIKGLFFFRDDLTGLNFEFSSSTLQAVLATILGQAQQPDPPGIFLPAAALESFPQIGRENKLDLLDKPAVPRLWVGNRVTTATHFDMSDNVHCVVAGAKRFTFFPPDQLPNLYVGPLDMMWAGLPTSLVKVAAPDLERYPRFAQAWAVAEGADLEPGDAVFIPNLWWHNVESLEAVNVSVNYWWFDGTRGGGEPFAAMAHALLAITPLPESRREIWRRMFEHFVFQTAGDPAPYLPPGRRGILGPLSPAHEEYLRTQLIRSLTKPMPRHVAEQILRLLESKR